MDPAGRTQQKKTHTFYKEMGELTRDITFRKALPNELAEEPVEQREPTAPVRHASSAEGLRREIRSRLKLSGLCFLLRCFTLGCPFGAIAHSG